MIGVPNPEEYGGNWYCSRCNRNVGPAVNGEVPTCPCKEREAMAGKLEASPEAKRAGQLRRDLAQEGGARAPAERLRLLSRLYDDGFIDSGQFRDLLDEPVGESVDSVRALRDLSARHEAAQADLHATKRERDELLQENARMRRRIESMERKGKR